MNSFIEMFSYSFMVKALVAGLLISISAALVGTPLVLRRNSMLSDGLSHVAFGAFAIASVLGLAPLSVALPIVVLVSFLILRLGRSTKINGDAAIALVSVSALAIGTFIVSLTGSNVDINSYLFGSILSINAQEIILSVILCICVLLIYFIFHRQIFAVTFDEIFAKSIGVNTTFYSIVFAILCSVVVVLGMRLMGALLISALIIFPVLSASTVFKSFRSVIVSGVVISAITFVLGLILSYLLATPTGATIVIVELVVFLLLKSISLVF